jgi:cysteine desulfurase
VVPECEFRIPHSEFRLLVKPLPIYLDNHATTRVDPRVVEAMLPYFDGEYGNAGSSTHGFGWEAKRAVDDARQRIAAAIGAEPREIVFTSGATESNNLALRGVAQRLRAKGNHIVSVTTEHPSVLDPLERLAAEGFEVTRLPVHQAPDPQAGRIAAEQVAAAITERTILVSVMLANNEIGVIHPLAEIGAAAHQRGVIVHTDATQAVGKIPVDVNRLAVDLMSFSAHKLYGPKGVGALWVRRRRDVRLEPILWGGGQERGLRSGTLNVPGIVGFGRAVELCVEELSTEAERLRGLRDRLWEGLLGAVPDAALNGPALAPPEWRLPGNLNVSFPNIDGESLLLSVPGVALSSGSACSSESDEPSHVLLALGVGAEIARSSVRFGLGRFNTAEEVERTISLLAEAVDRLRRLGVGG